jgi:hypothetical protein
MLDAGAPHGRHYYWKAQRLDDLSDRVVDVCMERMEAATSPFSQVQCWVMGGAASRIAGDATAVGPRDVGYEVSFVTGWPPSDGDGERHRSWSRTGWDALRGESTGVYANFISDEGAAGVDAAYGGRVARLTALKDRWDPANLFRMNANIAPSDGAAR